MAEVISALNDLLGNTSLLTSLAASGFLSLTVILGSYASVFSHGAELDIKEFSGGGVFKTLLIVLVVDQASELVNAFFAYLYMSNALYGWGESILMVNGNVSYFFESLFFVLVFGISIFTVFY